MKKEITALSMIQFNDIRKMELLVDHSFLVVKKVIESKEIHLFPNNDGCIVMLKYEKEEVLEKDYNALLKAYGPLYNTKYEEGDTKSLYRNLYRANILEFINE